jgi:hypothetical protein
MGGSSGGHLDVSEPLIPDHQGSLCGSLGVGDLGMGLVLNGHGELSPLLREGIHGCLGFFPSR